MWLCLGQNLSNQFNGPSVTWLQCSPMLMLLILRAVLPTKLTTSIATLSTDSNDGHTWLVVVTGSKRIGSSRTANWGNNYWWSLDSISVGLGCAAATTFNLRAALQLVSVQQAHAWKCWAVAHVASANCKLSVLQSESPLVLAWDIGRSCGCDKLILCSQCWVLNEKLSHCPSSESAAGGQLILPDRKENLATFWIWFHFGVCCLTFSRCILMCCGDKQDWWSKGIINIERVNGFYSNQDWM